SRNRRCSSRTSTRRTSGSSTPRSPAKAPSGSSSMGTGATNASSPVVSATSVIGRLLGRVDGDGGERKAPRGSVGAARLDDRDLVVLGHARAVRELEQAEQVDGAA